MKPYNFSAGPAILPEEVFLKSQEAIKSFTPNGLSILEISHRSSEFVEVLNRARSLVKELLDINDDYEILFLTGGASSQFFMIPYNFLNENETAGYIDTGIWSTKAIKESKLFGETEVVASSKEDNYSFFPEISTNIDHLKYLHFTSNNTIYGTQNQEWPESGTTSLICDMSSDIFSRPVPVEKFDLIYAGAQKNMGPAGVTLVIVRKEALGKVQRKIPSMLDYRVHIEKESSFNTPPVFPIYVSMLTLEWIKEQGGVKTMGTSNIKKAKLLYEEIDRNSLFYNNVNLKDRSLMNVPFHLKDTSLNSKFLEYSVQNHCQGLKGHRSTGGMRASIYNAMPTEGVIKLIEVMQSFEKKNQ